MKIGESNTIKELMQLFGNLDKLPFVRISQLNWIGHVNRMDSQRKVRHVFNNNSQRSRIKDDQNTDGGIVYKQILIKALLQIRNTTK